MAASFFWFPKYENCAESEIRKKNSWSFDPQKTHGEITRTTVYRLDVLANYLRLEVYQVFLSYSSVVPVFLLPVVMIWLPRVVFLEPQHRLNFLVGHGA
jgi:hypothetical protein